MSFEPHIYFCSQCKKNFKTLEELLFVEPSSSMGFCGEACIEKFYKPLVNYYEKQEESFREEHGLKNEKVHELVGQSYFTNELLHRPTSVYCFTNGFEQKFFTFIREMEDEKYGTFYLAAVCFTIDHRPSFIIAMTATSNKKLIKEFEIGERIENVKAFHRSTKGENKDQVEINEDTLMQLENKKSNYLAELLEKRSPADIPFEAFHLYEQFMESTMMDPDEIYSKKDSDGDKIFTYIKAQDKDGISFYHFIICMRIEKDWNDNTDALLPVISFPTLDGELYNHYKDGDLISGSLKN